MRLMVLNGPNLKRLDLRESHIYGDFDYSVLEEFVKRCGKVEQFEVDMRQSVDE